MRILAVTPYYAPEGGGLERYAHGILSGLVARGHEVAVLTCTRAHPGETIHDGVRVRRLRARLRLGNAPVAPSFFHKSCRAIDDLRPDVVLVHTPVPFPAEMASLAARRKRVPFVVSYHSGRLQSAHRLLSAAAWLDRRTAERGVLAAAAGLIAVGPYVRDCALRRHRERAAVVPPGVDAARLTPAAPAAKPEVLFVGPLDRAYAWKGVDVLWEAFRRVARRVPEARLVLVGSGDRHEEFAQKARVARGTVLVLPRLSESELAARYRRAAVVVLPSTSDAEAFGMVLAEANACGRPVVGSAIGGIPDFVRHGDNGLLVPPGDTVALAEALTKLLRDPRRADAMGMRGRARVLRDHAWPDLAAATEAVLQAAAGRAATGSAHTHPASAAAT